MKKKLLLIMAVILLCFPKVIFGQAINLGAASNFVLFTSAGAVGDNASSHSHLTGDIGYETSGAITGFGNVNGVMHPGVDAATTAGGLALLSAIAQINTTAATIFPPSGSLGNGDVFTPGVYSVTGDATLTSDLILDAEGDPNAEFIIKISGTFSANANSKVKLINEAMACHVFWQVGGVVSMASGATMRGNIIGGAAINMATGVTLEGRALTTVGAITIDGITAYTPIGCGSPYLTGPPAPDLASAACYTIFSSNGALANTPVTTSIGDVGNNGGGSITGWTAGDVTGTLHPIPDASTAQCAADLLNVYNYLNTLPYDIELLYPAQFGSSLVLTPHTYLMNAAATFTDTLYLNAQGNANAVFVIQINGALSTSTYAKVELINGAQAKNVFWMVQGAVDINNYSVFRGTIVVPVGAINLVNTGVVLDGRALTMDGAITTAGLAAAMPPGCGITAPSITAQPTDQTACAGSSVSFSVTATGTGLTYQWRKGTLNLTDGVNISGATSAILTINSVNISDAASDYNVVITDTYASNVTSNNVSLVVNPLPIASIITAGVATTFCEGDNVILSGNSDGTWSNAATAASITVTTSGEYFVTNTNACGSVTSNHIIVTVNPTPAAVAGTDAILCETGVYALIGSSTTNAVSQLWSTSGTGSFNDAAALHPVYTPSAADKLNGSVILTLTVTPLAPCPVISDAMVLTITHQAIVNAGSDATILVGSAITPFTVSTATAQYASSILWTHNGTGTLTGATTLTPTYTPALGETGVITLTVTAASASPCVSVTDLMTITITVNTSLRAGMVITKIVTETGFSAVGNIIHYNIDAVNISEISIYNISVSDPNAVISSGNPISILRSGTSATILATHTITQEDIDAGQVINCAFASGNYFDGAAIGDSSECVTVTGVQRPQITATKFATEPTFRTVGEIIHYTIEVFNCGNVTVTNIVVSDPKAVILTGSPIGSLAPRHTVTATAEHVVTQADVDAGKIANIAYIEGVDPKGKPVRDDSNEIILFANQPAQLVVAKFAEEISVSAKGDTIHYVIAVKNFRNTVMSDIVVSDPNATITSGSPIFRLASGKTALVNAFHVITQSDLDAGKVVNVATARGKDYYDFIDKATSNEVTVFAKQSPVLVLTKTAEETSYSNIGDLIHYSNEIKNTGNVKITGITLEDPNTSTTGSNQIASLNPGESATIRTTHTISQVDLNVGAVEKTASISGYDANIQPIRITSNQVIVKGVQNAQLATSLTSAETTYSLEGDIIHYTIEVRNTGNVTLNNLKITDATADLTKGNSIPSMVPGAVSVVTVEHLVTQADLLAGKVMNLATATGYNPVGEKISNLSNELTIVANKAERLIVTKIAQESSYAKVGEVIHYIITIKNNGKVPISNIAVSVPDAMISGNPMIASLSSAASATILAIHTITQADLDAGQINNAATVSGTYPEGTAYTEKSNPVTVYGLQDPQLNTSISASETSFMAVGEQINYTIQVKNTGNVSLTDIDLSSQGNLTFSGSPVINLAPDKSAELSALYTVTVADLDAGKIVKAVNATGKAPDNQPVGVTSNEITVIGLQNPELSTFASALENSFSVVGEVIHYNISVKNSGNVSIISTAVTDPNAVIITARPNTILLPGESFMASASHTITQADINAGKVVSEAKAAGFDLNGNTIEKIGNKVTVFGMQMSELVIETSTSTPNFKKVGDVIDYTISVKNLGNISVFNMDITDPNALVSLEQPVPTLLPGESTVVSASHVVTQADLDAGKVVNVAKASGQDMNGKAIMYSGNTVTIDGLQNHELATTTESSVTTYKREGEVIVYTVLVRNTGNVTMNNISITDAKDMLDFSSTIASLAPGESASIITQYSVSIDDINAGKLVTAPIAACYDTNSLKFSYTGNDVTVRLAIENFNLSNYPNPFAYETTIVFDLPENGKVILKVYDMTGREVGQIDQQEFNQGRNYVNWKSNNAQKGLYFLKMICNGSQVNRIMSIVN